MHTHTFIHVTHKFYCFSSAKNLYKAHYKILLFFTYRKSLILQGPSFKNSIRFSISPMEVHQIVAPSCHHTHCPNHTEPIRLKHNQLHLLPELPEASIILASQCTRQCLDNLVRLVRTLYPRPPTNRSRPGHLTLE